MPFQCGMFSLSVKVRSHHKKVNNLPAALPCGLFGCLAQTYLKYQWIPRLFCISESLVEGLGVT